MCVNSICESYYFELIKAIVLFRESVSNGAFMLGAQRRQSEFMHIGERDHHVSNDHPPRSLGSRQVTFSNEVQEFTTPRHNSAGRPHYPLLRRPY